MGCSRGVEGRRWRGEGEDNDGRGGAEQFKISDNLIAAPGDVALKITNDGTVAHDLLVKNGPRTELIQQGATTALELGRTRSRPVDGSWCTISTRVCKATRCTWNQFPQTVIAKDGLPLESPYAVDTISVAPGERVTVLVKGDKPSTWVRHCHILNHVERDEGMFGMVTAVIVS